MRLIRTFFVVLIFLSSPAMAELSLSAAPAVKYFHYQEFDSNNKVLDTEQGFLRGFIQTVEFSQPRWDFKVQHSHYLGQVEYDGQTQSGNPHKTNTNQRMSSSGIEISTGPIAKWDMRLFIKHSLHRWERDILPANNVLGLYEVYRWHETGLGLDYTLPDFGAQQFFWNINVFRIHHATMVMYAGSNPLFHLKPRTGFRGNAGWQKAFQSSKLVITAFYETWGFGRSDTVQSFYEPESKTHNAGLTFKLGWHF